MDILWLRSTCSTVWYDQCTWIDIYMHSESPRQLEKRLVRVISLTIQRSSPMNWRVLEVELHVTCPKITSQQTQRIDIIDASSTDEVSILDERRVSRWEDVAKRVPQESIVTEEETLSHSSEIVYYPLALLDRTSILAVHRVTETPSRSTQYEVHHQDHGRNGSYAISRFKRGTITTCRRARLECPDVARNEEERVKRRGSVRSYLFQSWWIR